MQRFKVVSIKFNSKSAGMHNLVALRTEKIVFAQKILAFLF